MPVWTAPKLRGGAQRASAARLRHRGLGLGGCRAGQQPERDSKDSQGYEYRQQPPRTDQVPQRVCMTESSSGTGARQRSRHPCWMAGT